MHFLLTLGMLGAFGAFWLFGKRYREGEAPFDRLPAGVSPKPVGSNVETVADGTRYLVYFWTPGADGRQFNVAEVKGKAAWISFWSEPSGKRTLYMSLAEPGDLNDLRKDWGV
jgi:hypothetical protein